MVWGVYNLFLWPQSSRSSRVLGQLLQISGRYLYNEKERNDKDLL